MPYYAVRSGRSGSAVYETWGECKKQVNGCKGAIFKKFNSRHDAEMFAFNAGTSKSVNLQSFVPDVTIYTDGSFKDELSPCGYAAVFVKDEKRIGVIYGPGSKGMSSRNVSGELEAAERAISKAKELGFRNILIRHDYEGVGRWADETWRRNLPLTEGYHDFVWQARQSMTIVFKHVTGHSGDKFNEQADEYADLGRRQKKEVCEGFEGFAGKPVATEKQVYICPACKKRVAKNAKECRHCGISFSPDGEMPVLKVKESEPEKGSVSERLVRRSVKYRGTDIKTGEFVYGVYMDHICGDHAVIISKATMHSKDDIEFTYHLVDPNSVIRFG